MKNRIYLILVSVILMTMFMAGCKSSGYVQNKNRVAAEKLRPAHKTVSATVSPFNLRLDMTWNDVIMVRAVPFGLAEVFRAELSQDGIILVNRLGHWYIRMDYNDIPYNGTLKVDFNTVQGLLWNKVFSPGASGAALKVKNTDVQGDTYREPRAGYTFAFQGGELVNVKRSIAGKTGTLYYGDFTYIDGESFPTHYSVSYKSGKGVERTYYSANLANVRFSDRPVTDRIDISQYHRRDFDFKKLKSLRNPGFSELFDLFR